MENIIEFTRQDICDLLGVTKDTLKKIEQKSQLYDRLYKRGWILTEKIKRGRNSIYLLRQSNENKLQYSLICENNFNTKEYESFGKYFLYRTYNLDQPITRNILAKLCEVCVETIRKWDGLMVENNILGKDGWYYLKRTRDKETNNFKWELTCREEFESYRRSSRLVKKISEVKNLYIENKIDLDTYTELIRSIEGHSCVLEEKAIYKVSKFYLKQDKELYEEIKSLIYKTYISEEKHFKLNFNK